MSDENPQISPLPPKAQTVLDAARDVFLVSGFSAATTDMIQQAAGVSKSTVYSHFPGKEALFMAVIEQECARHLAGVTQIRCQQTDLRLALHELSAAYLDIIFSPKALALYRVVVAESGRFPEIGQRFHQAGPQAFHRMLRQTLAEADARGEIRIGPAGLSVAATLYAAMLRGDWQMQLLLTPDGRPGETVLQHWIETVIDMFLRAHQ